MLTKDENEQLKAKGISLENFEKQLESFKTGFPLINISSAATIGDGIVLLSEDEKKQNINRWDDYLEKSNLPIPAMKFVPASGAASRMFKNLFEFLSTKIKTEFINTFFQHIKLFPFYDLLDQKCEENVNKSIDELIKDGKEDVVIENLLLPKGLNYGNYPKGLLPFHRYEDGPRTAFGEHMSESAAYTLSNKNKVNIHFTVSEDYLSMFQATAQIETERLNKKEHADASVEFSFQDPSTDTVAVDMQNQPIKTKDGKFLFRPGGHGSLIKNLNQLGKETPIVFIKNIDNVVPDKLKNSVIDWTKALGGYFIEIRNKVFEIEEELEKNEKVDLTSIVKFCEEKLFIKNISAQNLTDEDLKTLLKKKLNRPIRICGMVKNLGEPGGGPYYCTNADGTDSLQILERNQISDNDPKHVKALKSSTHFNPVNMVCGLTDFKGNKFDLTKFIDPSTAFISIKSKNGVTLKALEHPGLWNGSMSDWITIFVEMPANTFNPVKTVNDLLRSSHQQ